MIDKNLFRFDGVRSTLGLLAALSLVQGIGVVVQAYGLTLALVRIWHLQNLKVLVVPVLIFLAAYTCRQLCDVAKDRFATDRADAIIAELRPRIQDKVFSLGPSALARRGTGSAVTMLVDGLDQVRTYVLTVLPKMMDLIFIPLIVLVVVWTQDAGSGLILLLMLPLLIFFMVILGLAARDRSSRQYAQFRKLNTRFMDTVLGLPTLKMLGIDKEYEDEIYSVSDRFRKRTMSVIRVAMTSTFALDFFATLAIAIMAVFLGNNLINAKVELFPALLALILAPEYFMPIRQFGDDFHATLNGKNALDDIADMLAQPEPKRLEELDWSGWKEDSHLRLEGIDFAYPGPKPVESNASAGAQMDAMAKSESQKSGKKSSKRKSSKVHDGNGGAASAEVGSMASQGTGDEAAVDSQEQPLALSGLDFNLNGFSKVAIVGRSGAGKSTLMDLLAGFDQPKAGAIDLDGHQLEHCNVAAWQRHISYIPQNPFIFHGTVADNIRFYKQDADDAAVARAADRAGLTDWLQTLSDGLDTRIGEGNRGISGGQAQRIALARGILDPSREILFFDEPTAHLDIETEYDLKQTLLPIMDGHLVVLATHRLHWLANMDWVIMLEHGRIVAQGDPRKLIGQGGPLDALIDEMGGNQIADYQQD
ncbi:ABC transporter ATP-binding protein/permease [Bifidobacterium sp. H6bp9]|uniref:ABC transporter ATP-binding protein/permease n=1 Tax=Bifidobacterium sp. H6bp9 TaxID=3051961 RepID=UPI0028BF4F6C|nr:ABC transporter ATP-binding protein/permease [Bifidobacterium sp. H6bp9]MDT7511376.1 ABC transporter ATP-binding protein/permease [Bifidobacterium sp. H6bp9]